LFKALNLIFGLAFVLFESGPQIVVSGGLIFVWTPRAGLPARKVESRSTCLRGRDG
jgi:hypothetical protein